MNADEIARFRAMLLARDSELRDLSGGSSSSRKPVELDQQSVGRLSRQDALQQQAMAKAQDARRAGELRLIAAALTRIDDGEFGDCAQCGEPIAVKRLEINPTTELCVACASSR